MGKIQKEVSESRCESSRGKANPRGVRRKMSSFKLRKRGELLNKKRDITPEILQKTQPR